MFLTRFGLSRPIVVRMALILILLFGIYSYNKMPRYLDPDITIGEGMIVTLCPGFSPEEMEKLVTKKIEDELEGIAEIRRYESTSFESTSKIHVYYLNKWGKFQAQECVDLG
jgi:multidrug efflux pump